MSETAKLYALRRKRLLQLVQTQFNGNQTRLAEAIGRSTAYVSFLLAEADLEHHKNLGEKLARHIELAAALPRGWLDGEDDQQKTELRKGVIAYDDYTPPPKGYTLVRRRNVNLSAGNGALSFEEEDLPPLAFRTDWLTKENLNPDKLGVSYAKGDSMMPRIHDGDAMLIDTEHRSLQDGKIYALRFGDELRVKKIYKRTLSVILHSDNPDYPPEEISHDQAEHLHVIGRVVWVSGTL